MGILDQITDAAVKKIGKKETIRLPYDQMAKLVQELFITGADDNFLAQVQRAAKGGGLFTQRTLNSKSGRYQLHVGNVQNGVLLTGRWKTVWIFDNDLQKFYQLDKDRMWKKFYQSVDSMAKMERINRSK